MKILKFENKKLRSRIIAEYVKKAGYKGVVCFSCGHATDELKKTKIKVIDIAPNGSFSANRWFKPEEIYDLFKDYFDATSGHLPFWLMFEIGKKFKKSLGVLKKSNKYIVPSGSGETILCLKMVYPDIEFIARYNINRETQYEKNAVLNNIVQNWFNIEGV